MTWRHQAAFSRGSSPEAGSSQGPLPAGRARFRYLPVGGGIAQPSLLGASAWRSAESRLSWRPPPSRMECRSASRASRAGSQVEGSQAAAASTSAVRGCVDGISAQCHASCVQESKGHRGAALSCPWRRHEYITSWPVVSCCKMRMSSRVPLPQRRSLTQRVTVHPVSDPWGGD